MGCKLCRFSGLSAYPAGCQPHVMLCCTAAADRAARHQDHQQRTLHLSEAAALQLSGPHAENPGKAAAGLQLFPPHQAGAAGLRWSETSAPGTLKPPVLSAERAPVGAALGPAELGFLDPCWPSRPSSGRCEAGPRRSLLAGARAGLQPLGQLLPCLQGSSEVKMSGGSQVRGFTENSPGSIARLLCHGQLLPCLQVSAVGQEPAASNMQGADLAELQPPPCVKGAEVACAAFLPAWMPLFQ